MPDFAVLKAILDATERGGIGNPVGRETTEVVLEAYRRSAKAILVPEELRNFIVRLVTQTHPEHTDVEAVKKYVRYGASPRCAVGLLKAARARAVVAGRPHASFEDVEALFKDLANHRVILNFEAETDGVFFTHVLEAVLSSVRKEYRGVA